jgi:hypothetical protein
LRATPQQLQSIAQHFGMYIAGELRLKDRWWRRERFDYFVATGSEAAKVLGNALRSYLYGQTRGKPFIVEPGEYRKGDAVIIADAMRTGEALVDTCKRVQAAGGRVKHIFGFFDYEFGAADTLHEVFGDSVPAPQSLLRRQDQRLANAVYKHVLTPDALLTEEQRKEHEMLGKAIFEYQRGPLTYAISRLFGEFVEQGKEPHEVIVYTRGDTPENAIIAMERTILRYSVEVALYTPEQTIWCPDLLPPGSKKVRDDVLRQKRIEELRQRKMALESRLAAVQEAYLKRYQPRGLPWMEALPALVRETVHDAVLSDYSLNGSSDEHIRHVRQFVRLLKKHQPGIPHNVCGLPDWEALGVGTDVYKK